ncbi:hypothetical protein [Prosthecobacter sp.]|uniref:hypothetical protein n=1 Tax=Prosthecobacter sp. TaxID=1965333 RepID=UPI003784FFF5
MPARFVGESIAIHAAKRETQDERDFWLQVVMAEERRKEHARAFGEIGIRKYWDLPRGAIIGEVKFGASIRSEDMDAEVIEREEWWGNYSPGRFAWPVLEFRHYLTPVPFVGKQGFFEFEVPMGKEPDHG